MREHMDMTGQLRIALTDRSGALVYENVHKNLIVKSGRQLVAQLFGGVQAGTPPSRVTHMGVGTGSTAAIDDQLDLVAPRLPRNPITSVVYNDVTDASGGTPVKRIKVSLQTVFDFGEANGTTQLREAGIFTAATGGVMYNRVVFDGVTKSDTFKLTLLWDILF